MSPLVGLFQQRCVQEMVERILYIWAIRHPASGYVQGINDLVTPFLMVFLQDFVDKDVTRNSLEFESLDETIRKNIEADSFWCMTKVLDGIQDNYTFAQPGIQVKIRQLEELLKRVDVKLHNHIVGHDVQYLQFSFRLVSGFELLDIQLTNLQVDEQLATEGVATERHHQVVGHLPLGARRLQQVPPLRVRCLSLPMEARSGAEKRFSKHSPLHSKCANS